MCAHIKLYTHSPNQTDDSKKEYIQTVQTYYVEIWNSTVIMEIFEIM